VIGPDATILVDYMLTRFSNIVEHLIVYPETMKANLEKMEGSSIRGGASAAHPEGTFPGRGLRRGPAECHEGVGARRGV